MMKDENQYENGVYYNQQIRSRMILDKENIDETINFKAPKKGRGRPTIDPYKVLPFLCEAFRLDASEEQAIAYAGVSNGWFYTEKKNNPKFLEEIERAKMYPFLVARGAVVGAIEQGDPNIAMKFLERRDNKVYTTRTELAGDSENPIAINLVEEAKKRAKKYADKK